MSARSVLGVGVVFLLLAVLGAPAPAQKIDGGFNPSSGLIPSSPEAAALINFIDVPVTPYTGIPRIEIPIATVAEHRLSVPVSLSYHAGGHRVDEIANWVGLGWKLNAGGMIARKVRGLPDDARIGRGFLKFRETTTYQQLLQWLDTQNENNFQSMAMGCWDAEPDEYYFELNGLTGKFSFDWENHLPLVSSADDVKVLSFKQDAANTITEWRLAGPDGVIYTLSAVETIESINQFSYHAICASGNQRFASAWYVTRIEDPNRPGQQILFDYEDYLIDRDWVGFETRAYSDFGNPNSCAGSFAGNSSFSLSRFSIGGKRLARIRTSSGSQELRFEAKTKRTDVNTAFASSPNLYRLDDIVRIGANGQVLGSHHLDYFYQGRLMLAAVQETAADGRTVPPYAFHYDPTPLPPVNSRAVDHWGFYNGANNQTLLPEYLHRKADGWFVHFPGADREPHFDYTRASVLREIVYPTGGSVTLDYEPNEYSYIMGTPVAALQQFESHAAGTGVTAAGNPNSLEWVTTEKSFSIASPESSVLVTACVNGVTWATFGGQAMLPQIKLLRSDGSLAASWTLPVGDPANSPPYCQQMPCSLLLLAPGTYTVVGKARKFPGAPGADSITLNLSWSETVVSAPVVRKKAGGLRVREALTRDADGRQAGLRRYRYEMETPVGHSSGVVYAEPVYVYEAASLDGAGNECRYVQLVGSSRIAVGGTAGSHIGYRRVVEEFGAEAENGTIVHEFTSPFEYGDALNTVKPFKDPTTNSFKTGLLKRERTYDRQGKLVRDQQLTYEFVSRDFPSLKVSFGRIAPPAYSPGSLYEMMLLGAAYSTYSFDDKFAFSYAPYRLGFARLKKTREVLDGVARETEIGYDPQQRHSRPVAAAFTNSDGKRHLVQTDYAHEAAVGCLLAENMVALPVATRVTVGGEFVGGSRIAYGGDGFGGCAPLAYYEILPDGSEVLRAEVPEYHANGFPARLRRPGFPEERLVWQDGLLVRWEQGSDGAGSRMHVKRFDYDPASRRLARRVDIDGQTADYAYDGFQRLAQITTRGGRVVETFTYEYGAPNRVTTTVSFTDAPSRTTEQTYDGLGRPLTTRVNGVVKKEIEYDALGRLKRQTHLPGNFERFVYDGSPLNRPVEKVLPDESSILTEYGSENGYFARTVVDENNSATVTLTDLLGRVCEVRNALGGVTRHEYDGRGNLIRILPPGGSPEQAFEFVYDARSRLTAKKEPGAEWHTLVYSDANDLPVKAVDGEGRVLEFAYDSFGRQKTIKLNGAVIRKFSYDTGTGASIGRVVAAENQVLNGTGTLVASFAYDDFGRAVSVSTSNHLGGTDVVASTYNDADQLVAATRTHSQAGGSPLVVKETRRYDAFGRVVETAHFINGAGGVISANTYNDRDQLTVKLLGGGLQTLNYTYNARGWLTAINQPLTAASAASEPGPPQPATKSLAGWSNPGDLFYLRLFYGTGLPQLDAVEQHNGNLAAMIWQTPGRNRQAYGFQYDELNRLVKAAYAEIDDAGNYSTDDRYGVPVIAYDAVGNILSLERRGPFGGPGESNPAAGVIDRLAYLYSGTRLKVVDDQAPAAGRAYGYRPPKSGHYSYDKNGNLTFDPSKNLAIGYNYLNLPETMLGSASIRLTYDAAGRKLRRDAGSLGNADYVDGIEYRNGAVHAVHHGEGRAVKTAAGGWLQEYWIRDHLGNVRIAFADRNGDGKIQLDNPATPGVNESEILQENHFYPFGLPMTGPWQAAASGSTNRHLFNGQEYHAEGGLNWYDFGGRWYDPAIGRWNARDPLARQYGPHSPYAYALNRPVNAIDPDGRLVIFVNGFMMDQWLGQDNRRTIPIPQYGGGVELLNPGYRPYPPERTFTRGGPEYLGQRFAYWQDQGADLLDLYRQGFGDGNFLFVSATADNGSQAMDRFNEGQAAAKSLIAQIENGDITLAPGETIKIVGHSQGAAFAAGMAWTLANDEKYAGLLEAVHYLAPHQPGDFMHPATVPAVQFSTRSDKVSSAQTVAMKFPNPLMWFNGGSEYARIHGVGAFIERGSYAGGRGGHSAWTYLDLLADYFCSLGVPVTVRN
jgi:RHS repeat-associated protein